jgi:hypothetical protein
MSMCIRRHAEVAVEATVVGVEEEADKNVEHAECTVIT